MPGAPTRKHLSCAVWRMLPRKTLLGVCSVAKAAGRVGSKVGAQRGTDAFRCANEPRSSRSALPLATAIDHLQASKILDWLWAYGRARHERVESKGPNVTDDDAYVGSRSRCQL